MTPETVMDLARQGMMMALMLAIPPLSVALILGLLVSLFQAATQINEMTLSFIPKILGVVLVLVLSGPFMIAQLVDFTRRIFENIPMMASM
jgi:flagellar biosynthetic protein FliQ